MPIELNIKLTPIPGIPKHLPLLSPLGLLAPLAGTWQGHGFNQIFRPFFGGGSDNFLELNLTNETLEFTEIPGEIPNRGLLQADISLFGLTYLQQVADANVKGTDGTPAGIHIEPGIWVNVPATTNPSDPATVARMANIPHGTSLVAQGTAQVINGAPQFAVVDITPFSIGNPASKIRFPSQTLATPSQFRSPPGDIVGVTQAMVDNPNSVLAAALVGKTITSTTVIRISTSVTTQPVPSSGGGTSNIAFLDGAAGGPNAKTIEMDATFWISPFTDAGGGQGTLLQYSQLVLLNFGPLSWPHVSVATLVKQVVKAPKEIKEIKEFKPEIKENKSEIKEHKPEIKETKTEIKEHKPEIKELELPPQGIPIPDPAGRAGPAEAASTAGRPFITPDERPPVGEAALGKDPSKRSP
ncbi:MAG TPA: heme-binding protein [Polyangiaceae bacterium]|jgi:hypothetical protein|nr:heme-binding protein [Polyangiaceae bacterium]